MPKNILFLMTDQQRADSIGYAPGSRVATRHMDRLAESAAFTNCITSNPICTPARCALLTGKYTHQINMLDMSGDLSQCYPTYLQALQQAGYFTAGIGKFHWLQGWPWDTPIGQGHPLANMKDLMRGYGLDYIWEVAGKQLALRNYCDYAAYLDGKGLLGAFREFVLACGNNRFEANPDMGRFAAEWPFDEADHMDIVTADRIIEAIETRPPNQPFFIFGSFCSPHRPFDPPRRYLDMVAYEEKDDFIAGSGELTPDLKRQLYRLRQYYKATIRLVDEQIGRIWHKLEQDDLLKDTVILLTSDHGEMMGDHFGMEKGFPFRQSVNVPLAIRHPDYLDRRLNTSPVELTDVTATILDVAGLDPQQGLGKRWPAFNDIVPCRSLLPILRGESERVRDVAFSECGIRGRWQAVQTEQWKYIRYITRPESPDQLNGYEVLYDLSRDPEETINCARDPECGAELDQCRRQLAFVLDATPPAQTSWAPLL